MIMIYELETYKILHGVYDSVVSPDLPVYVSTLLQEVTTTN